MNAYPNMPMQIDPVVARAKDESDLNTLSILHYVWTGLMTCSAFGIVGYFVLIAGVIAGVPSGPHGAPAHQAAAAGVVMAIGVITAILMVPLIVLHFLAAAALKKRTRYTLVMVMAGFTCLSVPLGTGLGIWTFLVMQRPGVKALFGRA